MSETINPITGLPAEPKAAKPAEIKVNPITGLEAAPKAQDIDKMGTRISQNVDVLRNMGAKEYESFKGYGVNVTSGIDHNEARAQNQSTIEKIARGVGKAYITAGGALAENTVGLLWGLGSVATGGNFYDNAFGKSIDRMNEWAAEVMPHYYTRKEQQADVFSLTNLTSANFWADKVANGVGYVMGSIATDAALAYVTGGTSLALTAAKYASKFGKAASVLNAAQKAKTFSNIYRTTKALQQGKKVADVLVDGAQATSKIKRLSGLKTAVAQAETGLISAIGESNVEARQAKHETLNGLIENWVNNNPGMTEEDIPDEVRAEMEDTATAAGNTVFAINLPVIGGTNALMLGRLAGPGFKKTARSLAAKRAQESIYNVKKALNGDNIGKFVDAGLDGGWARRTLTKASRKFGEPVKGMAEEAFQEGTQFFAGNFAKEYFSDNYLRGAESGTLVDAMGYGLSQTFGTKEGVESMLIGAIIGGGTTSVSRVSDKLKGRKSAGAIKQENTEKALEILNSGVFNGAIENLKLSNEMTKYAAVMESAAAIAANPEVSPEERKKAHKKFKDAQYKLISKQAFTLSSMGRMDLALEQLDDSKDLTDDEFKKAFGYDINEPLPEGGKAAIIDKLKTKLTTHKETLDRINEIAPQRTPTTGLPRKMMSEEAIEQENLEIESSNFYRQVLYNRATQLTGHMGRMDNMLNEMDKLAGDRNVINRDNLEEYEMDQGMTFFFEDKDGITVSSETKVGGKTKEELDEVESKIIDPQKKKDFATFKEDYLNLLAERQEIINSYEALTGPEGPATAEYLKNRQEALDMLASRSTAEIETEELLNNAEVPSDLLNKIPEEATAEQKERAKAKIIFLEKEVSKLAAAYKGQTLDQLRAIDKDKLEQLENGKMQVAALEEAIKLKENEQKLESKILKKDDQGNEVDNTPKPPSPPSDPRMSGPVTDINALVQAQIDAQIAAMENASGDTREQGAGQGRGVTADQLNLSDDQDLGLGEDQESPRERISVIPYGEVNYTITEDERILTESKNGKPGREVYSSNTATRRKILANYRVANKQAVVVKPKTKGLRGKEFTVSRSGVILNNATGTVMGEFSRTTQKNLTAEDRKIILNLAEGQFAAMTIQAAPKKSEEVKQVAPAQGSIDVSLLSTNFSTSEGNSNNVFVTESGELERNIPSTQTVDGEVIVIEDGELYDPNNTLEGQTITFEVREDTDWAKTQEELSWKNVPIFVVLNGRRVGLLQSYFEDSKKGSARQEIFRIAKEGGTPTATISGKGGFKFINAVNQDGTKAFTNPLTEFENPIFAVVSSENGMLRYQLGEVTGVPAEELAELEDSLVERNSKLEQDKVTEGQIVMMVKTPTGKYAPFPLSTKYLTDSDIEYTLKFMAEGKAREAMEIAGFSGDPYNWNSYAKDRNGNAKKSFLYYVEAGTFYVFHSDSAGQLVSINPEELTKMLNGEGFRFSFVEGPSKEADELNDNFITTSERGDYSSVASKLKEDLTNLLQRKKYQVSKESINNKTSRRVNPITGESQDYRTYLFDGGIVLTDARNNNGGPFHGAQLKFGTIQTEGKPAPKEETDTTILSGPEQDASGKFERTTGKRKGKKRPSKPTQQTSEDASKVISLPQRDVPADVLSEMRQKVGGQMDIQFPPDVIPDVNKITQDQIDKAEKIGQSINNECN